MKNYEIVKIGDRHEINGEFFSQDVIEIYPLDDFRFTADMANEIYMYIKGVDPDLTGAFPILEFEDGDYLGCAAIMGIIEDGKHETSIVLSVSDEDRKIVDNICRLAYYEPKSKVEQWSRLMQIVEDNDLLGKVIDYVNLELDD